MSMAGMGIAREKMKGGRALCLSTRCVLCVAHLRLEGCFPVHCLTALGQWAVELLLYSASLPGGSGQWYPCGTLPHCLGAVGSGTPAVHCRTAFAEESFPDVGRWLAQPPPPPLTPPADTGYYQCAGTILQRKVLAAVHDASSGELWVSATAISYTAFVKDLQLKMWTSDLLRDGEGEARMSAEYAKAYAKVKAQRSRRAQPPGSKAALRGWFSDTWSWVTETVATVVETVNALSDAWSTAVEFLTTGSLGPYENEQVVSPSHGARGGVSPWTPQAPWTPSTPWTRGCIGMSHNRRRSPPPSPP